MGFFLLLPHLSPSPSPPPPPLPAFPSFSTLSACHPFLLQPVCMRTAVREHTLVSIGKCQCYAACAGSVIAARGSHRLFPELHSQFPSTVCFTLHFLLPVLLAFLCPLLRRVRFGTV